MRHRDDHDRPAVVLESRPSLPRLKNKKSLGRLNAYGGVLDFESAQDQQQTVPAVPSFYRNAPSTTSTPATANIAVPLAGQDHNSAVMQPRSQRWSSKQHEQDELQRTPPKNTTQATLRALNMMDREQTTQSIKYPASILSNVLPGGAIAASRIPTLDPDHRHQLQQPPAGTADQTGITSHSQSCRDHEISAVTLPASSSSLPVEQPASDVCSGSSSSLGGDCGGVQGQSVEGAPSSREREREKDEERLVREIREDMDEGGYASLEQVRSS